MSDDEPRTTGPTFDEVVAGDIEGVRLEDVRTAYAPKVKPIKVAPPAGHDSDLLPCGCFATFDHVMGDRLVVCSGGGVYSTAEGERECEGGRGYRVSVIHQPVRYRVEPMRRPGLS